MVYDNMLDKVIPCSEASPILKKLEYTSLHRLRYYAETSQASEILQELKQILKRIE